MSEKGLGEKVNSSLDDVTKLGISDSDDEHHDKTEILAEPAAPLPPMHPSMFPDGGPRAWLCVAGGAACLFCSFGWINCIGVFQDYYERGPLNAYDPSTVGWIPSCEVFFMLFCGPFVGYFFDNFGPRYLLLTGTFLHVFGLMMTSISTEYYQFFLSQGVCSAIGASMLFTPPMTSTATWFFQRRGLAMGLVAAGSSLGGVIFPIMLSRLVVQVGFGWAMRSCAFLILFLMIFANLTVTSRVPPTRRPFEPMAFVRPLREPAFLIVTIALFLFYYGMFVPFSFIVTDANLNGMSLQLSQYLVSIINAASIFGRTLPGYIGDKVGRFNTMVVFCALAGILVLAVWIPAASNAAFLVFSPLFGFASGAAIGLTPALFAQISDVKELGVRTGTAFGIASIAALTGTPIAGALVGSSARDGNETGLTHMKIFAGVMCLVGTFFFAYARVKVGGYGLMTKV